MKQFDLVSFPTSSSAKQMLSYVSDGFYENSYVGKWLFQVMGEEYDTAKKYVEELPDQFFPETATWGLCYHEMKWQLPVREHLSYEERRRLIYQKRDYRSPMTPYFIEQYLKNITNFEIHIYDIHDAGPYIFQHPNVFRAVFIGKGTLNVKEIRNALDSIKQSHTLYTIDDRVFIVINHQNMEQFFLTHLVLSARFFFWKDVSYSFLNRMKMRTQIVHSESIDNVSLITRRNLWYLDGTVSLDGSRKLNAMKREEML